jgi:hypothetical protein
MDRRDEDRLVSVPEELLRLRTGPAPGEHPGPAGTVRFVAQFQGNAETVLANCKQVLAIVLERSARTNWPTVEEWRALLPIWFVRACAPEQPQEEIEREAAHYRQLAPEERRRLDKQGRWTVGGWVHWLRPDARQWWWWNGAVWESETVAVDVQVDDWPHAVGAIEWLLRACGLDPPRPPAVCTGRTPQS